LVDHVHLLRKVIAHPKVTQKGKILNDAIDYYCQRMSKREINTEHEQRSLPWQVEWIWHVHRLHPVAYRNDCMRQFSGGVLIDKLIKNLDGVDVDLSDALTPIKNNLLFVPSIDLTEAVLRQRDFLDKFEKHVLYSSDVSEINVSKFQHMIQNYVSFIKLAQPGKNIVPTFDIDLIWHTHMRYPSAYHAASIDLCGYILDHNDSIPKNILENTYTETATRWALTYKSEYGYSPDWNHLKNTRYLSSCAMVVGHSTDRNNKNKSNDVAGGCASCGSGGYSSSCDSGCGGCGD
jgi:hypothetical protein